MDSVREDREGTGFDAQRLGWNKEISFLEALHREEPLTKYDTEKR